jgi:hypothetical protein
MPRGSFNLASMRMIANLAAAVIVVAAVAADAPVSPPPATSELPGPTELPAPPELPQAGAGSSTQSGMPGCAVWTDRCIICQRDGGVIACSNIGIACQPQAMLCLRAEAAEEKKQPN